MSYVCVVFPLGPSFPLYPQVFLGDPCLFHNVFAFLVLLRLLERIELYAKKVHGTNNLTLDPNKTKKWFDNVR